jgi:hypothetical protein
MRIGTLAVVALAATSVLNGQQIRDLENVASAARAEVSGVVTDEAGQPVRRAFVELSYSRRMWRQVVVTGTDGRFTFMNVPAGAYDLAATRPPFLPARYGATLPGGKGITLVLTDAARVTDTRLTLVRGAVIAGRVTDERGDASSGIVVRLSRRTGGANGTAFERVDSYANTDDRGEYRIFGLAPGEYLVTAAPAGSGQSTDVRVTTQAAIDRALHGEGRDGAAARSRDSSVGAPAPGAGARTTVAMAPVYYPGTTNAALASVVTLAVGEERARIDFQMQVVRTARMSGTVSSVEGPLPDGLFVTMLPTAFTRTQALSPITVSVSHDGAFSFAGVPPGDYLIAAGPGSQITATGEGASRTVFGGNPPRVTSDAPSSFGAASVRVDGADVSGVVVTIQRGLDVAGRVALVGASAMGAVPMSVVLKPAEEVSQIVRQAFAARPDAPSGRFVISGVTPGRYRLGVAMPLPVDSLAPPLWTLRSATLRGENVTDLPFDLARDAEPLDLVVTMTDRLASLQGQFRDASARPVTEFSVVLFPVDRAFWSWNSRRVLATRPSSDGNFRFADVPPGDYWLAAAAGLESSAWFETGLLEQLTAAAIRVSVAEGERKTQDIALPK